MRRPVFPTQYREISTNTAGSLGMIKTEIRGWHGQMGRVRPRTRTAGRHRVMDLHESGIVRQDCLVRSLLNGMNVSAVEKTGQRSRARMRLEMKSRFTEPCGCSGPAGSVVLGSKGWGSESTSGACEHSEVGKAWQSVVVEGRREAPREVPEEAPN